MKTLSRLLLLKSFVSMTLITHGQFVEKTDMSFRNARFDILVIKIDSLLADRISFAENIGMAVESKYLDSIGQITNSSFFAITASVVDSACNPLGLFVSEGREYKNINLAKGAGNFFIRPNGIFAITRERDFFISDASKFDTTKNLTIAIQSGPMLLSNGMINPNFDRNSKNKHIRCSVGLYVDKGTQFLVFVKSADPISFFQMAQLLQEKFNCQDALNLESGSNCSMHPIVMPGNYDDQKMICRYLLVFF